MRKVLFKWSDRMPALSLYFKTEQEAETGVISGQRSVTTFFFIIYLKFVSLTSGYGPFIFLCEILKFTQFACSETITMPWGQTRGPDVTIWNNPYTWSQYWVQEWACDLPSWADEKSRTFA